MDEYRKHDPESWSHGPIFTHLPYINSIPLTTFGCLPEAHFVPVYEQFARRWKPIQEIAGRIISALPATAAAKSFVSVGVARPSLRMLPEWSPSFSGPAITFHKSGFEVAKPIHRQTATWNLNRILENAQNGEFGYPVIHADIIPPHVIPNAPDKRGWVDIRYSEAGTLSFWQYNGRGERVGYGELPSTARLGFTEVGSVWLRSRTGNDWVKVGEAIDSDIIDKLMQNLSERNLVAPQEAAAPSARGEWFPRLRGCLRRLAA